VSVGPIHLVLDDGGLNVDGHALYYLVSLCIARNLGSLALSKGGIRIGEGVGW
jgi:hypothetical protein